MNIDWQAREAIDISSIDKRLQTCLFQEGSLTRYLQQHCKGLFQVEPETEAWQTPMPDEVELLSLTDSEEVFVRESWLKSDEQRLVYARTVIPKTTVQGEGNKFTKLGKKPLGEILFADDTTYRSSIRYAKISNDCDLFKLVSNKTNEDIWGRQSLFFMQKKPLLITEVFLPDLVTCIQL